jgi:hypothetical protein
MNDGSETDFQHDSIELFAARTGESYAPVAALLAVGVLRHLRGENCRVSRTFGPAENLPKSERNSLEQSAPKLLSVTNGLTGPGDTERAN